jgi:AcrR family transcriptional regulator
MTDDEEKLRADARANRDRILDVARQALAADPDSSLNSIAKTAGVGPGTLYRHFPSREALVLGVYRKEIDALVALAPALIAKHTPARAFSLWCDRLAHYGRMKHGIADVLHSAVSERDFQETYWPMVGAIRHILDAGEASGTFKPGTNAEDLLLLLGFLWRIPPGAEGKVRAERLLTLVLAGLRP